MLPRGSQREKIHPAALVSAQDRLSITEALPPHSHWYAWHMQLASDLSLMRWCTIHQLYLLLLPSGAHSPHLLYRHSSPSVHSPASIRLSVHRTFYTGAICMIDEYSLTTDTGTQIIIQALVWLVFCLWEPSVLPPIPTCGSSPTQTEYKALPNLQLPNLWLPSPLTCISDWFNPHLLLISS